MLLMLAGATAPVGAESTAAPGTSAKIVLDERAGGFRRSFRLHVPANADQSEPRPLVVALHGGIATARILEDQTGFSELADRQGFYVVYPNGLGVFSLMRHWNGGFCCAQALGKDLDDPGFVDRVIDWTLDHYPINPRRVYLVGYSNGGFLAYWYAALHAERLAGLGIWASSIGSLDTPKKSWTLPAPTASLPTLIAHGTDDRRLPWDTGAARGRQKLLGAVASAEAWARGNGCSEPPAETRSGTVLRRSWCTEGTSPVVLLGVEGWGHEWPGPKRTDRLDASHPVYGLHLAEEMWEFFSQLESPQLGSAR